MLITPPDVTPDHPYRFRLNTEINLGNVLTMLLLGIGAMTWGGRIETRISLNEAGITRQKDIDFSQSAEFRAAVSAMEARLRESDTRRDKQLDELSGKLDKLVEWQMRRYSMNGGALPHD